MPLSSGGIQFVALAHHQSSMPRKPRQINLKKVRFLLRHPLRAPSCVFWPGGRRRGALREGKALGGLPGPITSSALRRLGFEVTTEFDVDRVELTAVGRTGP